MLPSKSRHQAFQHPRNAFQGVRLLDDNPTLMRLREKCLLFVHGSKNEGYSLFIKAISNEETRLIAQICVKDCHCRRRGIDNLEPALNGRGGLNIGPEAAENIFRIECDDETVFDKQNALTDQKPVIYRATCVTR